MKSKMGKRFAEPKTKLASKGAKDPGAFGREKYEAKKMSSLAKGKKK